MANTVLTRNYSIIFKSFLSYLPSRLLVILNALFIVPVFAYFLTAHEMSIFQISIGILNFVCTVSTDWVAKSVLRFYEKYKYSGEIDTFFSSIALIQFILFGIIAVSYFIFKDFVVEKFYITHEVFLMTLILVIPCGIRQLMYQMLRILRKTFLYTLSIIIYQFTLLVLFFAFSHFLPNVISLLIGMTLGICFIDFLILYKVQLKEKLTLHFDKEILKTVIIYAIPLLVTNVCIWLMFNFGRFAFQMNKDFVSTAVIGTAWFFISSTLTPLFSLLMFAIFPLIVRRFEKKYQIKEFMASVLNSYIVMFLPLVCIFVFYSFDIAKLAFKTEYNNLGLLFPFCAVTIFIHEFMKLMNTKYHLKNKTYIETLISFFVAIICVIMNLVLIKLYGIVGFGISMVTSLILLLLFNSLVKLKYMNYLAPKKIFQCLFFSLLSAVISYLILFGIFFKFQNNFIIIAKIILFLILYIFIVRKFRKYIFV